jgi:hypothetical protein
VRNRTFFFATYEGTRQRQGIDINSGVLRDDQRSAVTDPVSRGLLPLIPAANATGASGEGRFVGAATAPVDIDQWTGDVRHNIGNSDALHWYYAFQKDLRGEPTLQLNTVPGFGDTRQSHRQIMTLNETHLFGSSLSNEARFGFNRIHITFEPNAALNPVDYGINNGVTTAIGLPQITIVGLGLNFGGPSNFPQGRTDTSFVFSDTANYLRGRHAIKFGGEFRRIMNDNFTSDTGTFQFGSLAAFQAGQGNNFTIARRPAVSVRRGRSACSPRTASRPVRASRSSWGCATTASWLRPRPKAGSWCSTRRPPRWSRCRARIRPATTSSRASARSGRRPMTGRRRCAARMP